VGLFHKGKLLIRTPQAIQFVVYPICYPHVIIW